MGAPGVVGAAGVFGGVVPGAVLWLGFGVVAGAGVLGVPGVAKLFVSDLLQPGISPTIVVAAHSQFMTSGTSTLAKSAVLVLAALALDLLLSSVEEVVVPAIASA